MIMKNNLLPVEVAQIAEKVSIEKRNEVQTVLNQVFDCVSKMREHLDSVNVVNENDKVNMKLANTIRLGVRQVRLDAEKTFDKKRDEVQQQMLSYKTEDQLWLKAKQTMQILTKEIEETARWKEETKARFDAEQKELKVQQRILKIQKIAPEMLRSEFEYMSDETFDIFFSGIEKAYNDRIEAEIKAKVDAELKGKAEAEAKYAAEQKAKIDAERKAKNASDKTKLLQLAQQIELLQMPDLKENEAKNILNDTKVLLVKVVNFIKEKSNKL